MLNYAQLYNYFFSLILDDYFNWLMFCFPIIPIIGNNYRLDSHYCLYYYVEFVDDDFVDTGVNPVPPSMRDSKFNTTAPVEPLPEIFLIR